VRFKLIAIGWTNVEIVSAGDTTRARFWSSPLTV
jgi:hypothetical protein